MFGNGRLVMMAFSQWPRLERLFRIISLSIIARRLSGNVGCRSNARLWCGGLLVTVCQPRLSSLNVGLLCINRFVFFVIRCRKRSHIFSRDVWSLMRFGIESNHGASFHILSLSTCKTSFYSENDSYSKDKRHILRGIVYTTLWVIWNERNARIFSNKHRRPIELVQIIKHTSYFWIRNRSRWNDIGWNNWCNYPLVVM